MNDRDRAQLHILVDQLSEDDFRLVRDLVFRMAGDRDQGADDELIAALESRPYDDEVATKEDLAAIDEALAETPGERVKVHAIEAELTRV